MDKLLELLKEKHLTLGSIESMTGGLFSATFCDVPGASKVFKGSIVTYATSEKTRLLGMNPLTIEKEGVVSEEVAKEMAQKGKEVLDVDVCVSITGNAGPSVEPGGKPVGRAYVGIFYAGFTKVFELNLKGSRNEIRKEAIFKMADLVIETIR